MINWDNQLMLRWSEDELRIIMTTKAEMVCTRKVLVIRLSMSVEDGNDLPNVNALTFSVYNHIYMHFRSLTYYI